MYDLRWVADINYSSYTLFTYVPQMVEQKMCEVPRIRVLENTYTRFVDQNIRFILQFGDTEFKLPEIDFSGEEQFPDNEIELMPQPHQV